ncbi:MAG: malonyl-CoA decarboxylase family protein, partial [Rhizobiaceae bacterium]|nr:malonyl-CoA decarboxylase family protein [Rhizobiaceae bacterium]
VSRFHLGNGAKLDRICFAADTSPKGIKQSHALMVNYRYDPGEIERNHEAFAESGTIAVNPEIVQLLSGNLPSKGEYSI